MFATGKGHGMELIESTQVFDGKLNKYRYDSSSLQCKTNINCFFPKNAMAQPTAVLYWLSGLTCTEDNFMQKAGALQLASALGIAIIAPDTSPRGEGIPDDEGYDLGVGAGFYVNATQSPWDANYQMYDYIAKELPLAIESCFEFSGRRAIAGHSMGGHGALIVGLSNTNRYTSISAFSPIVSPSSCPWGVKAFSNYLGEDQSLWPQYDACLLLENAVNVPPILIDQGTADQFFEQQLQTGKIEDVFARKTHTATVNYREGFDHSYYFIATFINDHLNFHAEHLGIK